MNQRELKERIMSDPDLTVAEKNRMLRDIRAPYYQMSDEELLQLIRDFVAHFLHHHKSQYAKFPPPDCSFSTLILSSKITKKFYLLRNWT